MMICFRYLDYSNNYVLKRGKMQSKLYITIWIVGVVAAAQLGKAAALLPALRERLHLTLTGAAWLASALELTTAVLAFSAWRLVAYLGGKAALLIALTLLAVATLLEGIVVTASYFAALRFAESVAYMLIAIAAPSILTLMPDERDRRAALILWSTFVPVGFALGAFLSGYLAEHWSVSAALIVWAPLSLLLLLPCLQLPQSAQIHYPRTEFRLGAVWGLAASFGCYAMIVVGIIVLLPTYLMTQYASSYSDAGAITGIASLASVLGSLCAHVGTRSVLGQDYRRRWQVMIALSLFGASLALFFLFPPFATIAGAGQASAAIVAGAFSAVLGVCPALIFARLPETALAGRKDGEVAILSANAALAQCGALGSLVGPPIFGLAVSHFGWEAVAPLAFSLAAIAVVLAALADRNASGAGQR
ncbi:MFS transporter [Agrobacterium sp. BT-220-3]|nr:MFS transporter [Agrobacterium sp. BT-220-3]